MATYQYFLTDFPNDQVNLSRFSREIANADITPSLTGLTNHSSVVSVDFDSDLSSGEQTTLDDLVANHNGQPLPPSELDEFLDENAEVTEVIDSTSTITGAFLIMQTLINRREIYNDLENPLYKPDVTPIVGTGGHLQDHANRINNLETIHGKLGWHNQEILEARFQRPDDLLIYYGWMNSFNSGDNGWNNENVAQDMAKYNLLVFGDGTQDPDHGDYSNTTTIIARIKDLNPRAKIFGYVTTNQSLANFQTKADQWDDLEIDGIFFDESGYDYGTVGTNGREAFNTKVEYVHDLTYANLCFVNAWNMDHIIGTANDGSYPNSTWNPNEVESSLTNSDYYLLESFAVNSVAYTNDYEAVSDWSTRGSKAIGHRATYGINLVGSCVIENGHASGSDLFQFAFISALMWSLDGFGSSDQNYGASSAAVDYWSRPDVTGVGRVYTLNASVQNDVNDSDVYLRFLDFAKLLLDFSSGAQTSSITKY